MKRFCIFCFLVGIITTAGAQGFKAGLRAGITATQVAGDRLTGFNKAGIVAGGFVNRDFSEKLSLRLEIIFIQKGSRKPVNTDDNSYYRMRLHYAEVPLLLIYNATKKISLEAGPSFGSLVFSQEDNQLGELFGAPPFKKYEISANAGVLFHLSGHWLADARYNWSLTTIRPYAGNYNYNFFDQGQYNSVMQVALLYQF
ncbi:MAG TPA: porin family protein [Bacteroidia bacterium]|nr:porin family protein [Bacteroidia bacterium]